MNIEPNIDFVEYVRDNDGELPSPVALPSDELIIKVLSSDPYANGKTALPYAIQQTLLLYGCSIIGMAIYLGFFVLLMMLIT